MSSRGKRSGAAARVPYLSGDPADETVLRQADIEILNGMAGRPSRVPVKSVIRRRDLSPLIRAEGPMVPRICAHWRFRPSRASGQRACCRPGRLSAVKPAGCGPWAG